MTGTGGRPGGEVTVLPTRHMLLSSVAESLYWAGRYLERAEGTARLVRTHTELYIDLPRDAGLDWAPLLAVTGSRETFDEAHDGIDEDDVVAFLLADPGQDGSVVNCLSRARENLRITRGFIPRRLWEVVNETDRWARASAATGCSRGQRLLWTEDVIRRCHTVTGSAVATMSRDQAYAFMAIGRQIEQADMTTRVLDVGGLTMTALGNTPGPYADIIWMKTLRSLGAEQMYRRQMGAVISSEAAVQFLLRDMGFPRSVEHSLVEISRLVLELPHHYEPMAATAAVQRHLDALGQRELEPERLGHHLDQLQVCLADLHLRLAEAFFLAEPAGPGR